MAERPRKPPARSGKSAKSAKRTPPPRRRDAEPRRRADEPRRRAEEPKGKQPPKKWGGVARRGAGKLGEDEATASRIWRDAVKRARDEEPAARPRPPRDWEPEVWQEAPAKKRAPKKQASPAPRKRAPRPLADEVASELTAARGEKRGTRLQERLRDAAGAFERGRYLDARRMLKPLADEAPGAASVRELYGLTNYHLERWRDAVRELEAFRALTGSVEQHPVLADAYRALGKYKQVDALWDELRQASPGPELVAEGRIVAAGAKADQGDIPAAIALLERAKLDQRKPKPHHLRLQYALADLYERAGDIPRARDLFRRIASHDPQFFDAATRAKALA